MMVYTKRERKEVMIMKGKINAFAIGERLKRLRGDRTLKEVSERVGISESALSMYENGARIPRDEIKIKLANYYKKTIQSIFFT
jgi:hypothetical protein